MTSNLQPVIFGCGHLGSELVALLAAQHTQPLCVVQSQNKRDLLRTQKLNAQAIDLDDPACSFKHINLAQRDVYYLVPPGKTDDCDYRIDRVLDDCRRITPRRIVYISTSGVYGDCKGNWVTETQPTAALTARARRRCHAERSLTRVCQQTGCEFIILRVGGIYSADRLPLHRLQDIKLVCPEEAPFSNRIHVHDLARICIAAMQVDASNEIINVADGNPTTMTDYYYRIADLAGLPRPPCVSLARAASELPRQMLTFVNESRRLCIDKMNRLLNIPLQFPTLESGLKACFRQLRMRG